MHRLIAWWLGGLLLLAFGLAHAVTTPACRQDARLARPLAFAAQQAIDQYRVNGIALPFAKVSINQAAPDAVQLEIVLDATRDQVDAHGCIRAGAYAYGAQKLDEISVRGGCYVSKEQDNLIRCSAGAVDAFVGRSADNAPASPALLYVIAHEIAHIYQKRRGEFAGKTVQVQLHQDQKSKLDELSQACNVADIRPETDADVLALTVLRKSLASHAYKDPALSTRGAVYWNVDKINLAADTWMALLMKQGDLPQTKLHPSFVATEFPMPKDRIHRNANRFVCDVLTRKKGVITFPLRQTTHPAPEQRLRQIAVALKEVAEQLPSNDGSNDFKSIATLQNGLGAIFTHMYRENGIYLEALHGEICTLVNSETPVSTCKNK